MTTEPSPGNGVFPNGPFMRQPSLVWMYRLECDVSKEEIELGAAHDAGVIRRIMNLERGTIKGPGIEATILPLGGADWLTVIKGTHVRENSNIQGKFRDWDSICTAQWAPSGIAALTIIKYLVDEA